MGLDMYLNRFPRYKHYSVLDMEKVDSYLEWLDREKEHGAETKKYTLKEWCGIDEKTLPPKEDLDHLISLAKPRTYAWDYERKYERVKLNDGIAYWRKANAVHKWFVDNIQDGVDDCNYHREVTQQDLEALRDACKEILEKCVLVKGKVQNGWKWDDKKNKEIPNYQDGMLVANPDVCEKILPSCDGFFFGGTGYDEWYMRDIKYTFETLNKVIEETDFEKQQIWYCSSW